MCTKRNGWIVKYVTLWFRIIFFSKWFHAIVDITLKIGKLSSLEEIAVGIVGEQSAKSGALSHYEDRRERKGWLVEGVHGISIARRNNWVQSGRLPYVTSAPFKQESASASSSSSSSSSLIHILALVLVLVPVPVPVLPFSSFSSSPGLASAPAKRPARRAKKESRRRRLPGEVYEDVGRTGEGREGQEEDEAERDGEKRSRKGRGRHGSGRKEEHAYTVETGAGDQGRCWYQSPLSVTEEEEGRNRGKKNAEERSRGGRGATGLWTRTTRQATRNKSNERAAQNNSAGSKKGEES